MNFTSFSKEAGISVAEVKRLLFIFRNMFIIALIETYLSNKKLEIIKNPKLYFLDNGLRNAVLKNFSQQRADLGVLYESFVLQELLKQGFNVNFWCTKGKSEVDFILQINGQVIPIEVKVRDASITCSYRSSLEKYRPSIGFLFNLSERTKLKTESAHLEKRFLAEIIHFKDILEFGSA